MSFISNLRIAPKILGLLLLMGLLTLGISLAGWRALDSSSARYAVLVEKKLPASTYLARANRRAVMMDFSGYEALTYDAGTEIATEAPAKEEEAFVDALKLIVQARAAFPEHAVALADFTSRIQALHGLTKEATRLGSTDRNDEAKVLVEQADKIAIPLGDDIAAFNNARLADAITLSMETTSSIASTGWTLLVISLLGIVAGIGISLLVSRFGITAPLTRLHAAMATLAAGNNGVDIPGVDRGDEIGQMAKTVLVFRDAAVRLAHAEAAKAEADATLTMVVETVGDNLGSLARGDLTAAIAADFPGIYAALKTNFNEATASLRELIGSVTETANSIQTGSHEIATASEDLARRTEGNAASLEETSAAIRQIDDRLKATATAAKRSVAGCEQTMTAVGDGRTRTDQAVQAMGRVSNSAKGIDSVIEGLDKIAFQTRVLAMNAAVEAGRAGDAGRGFAVVADLVSALAMRAEEEAKRARDQLTVTQTEIVSAVGAVQHVEGALSEIFSAGQEAATLANQIASDNLAQASAITQVSTAISAMDQSTQQNAAMVEQTSAAARNLTNEVNALAEQAGRFDIGKARSRPIVAAPLALAPRAPTPSAAYVSPVRALAAVGGGSSQDWNDF